MKYFILNGPTASGKSILMDYILSENSDFLEPIISFTTRQARPGERHGKDYYFINCQQYVELLQNHQIAEKITYLERFYGVTCNELTRVAATNKNGIAIMNLEGIRQLKQNVAYQKVISIFIYRDLSAIFKTISASERSEDEKAQRMDLARYELKDITACDYVVYNTASLAEASAQLLRIIRNEINSKPVELAIKPGQRYKHYSGDVYEIVSELVEHSETCSPLVVYRNVATGKLYARPYELFCGKKEWPPSKGQLINRFELIP